MVGQCGQLFSPSFSDGIDQYLISVLLTTCRIRDVGKAHKTLDAFMHAQIAERRMEVRSGSVQKDDVFSMLVRANEDDNGKFPLDDSELVS